jgi:glycosyltransferase involved in cell wall biosynthesis
VNSPCNISVILPNYNHSRFLNERVSSILNQTCQNFELIILDDCSTDDSRQLLAQWKNHPRISHFIMNEQNSGSTFKQWKRGLELAKGEWIWIAESDDVADVDFLQKMMELVERDKDIQIAFCRSNRVDENGKHKGINRWGEIGSPDRWNSEFISHGNDECADYLLKRNTIPNASAVVFRRRTALKHIDHVLSYRFCGDWLFWALLAKEGKVAYSPIALNSFRRYASATSLVKTRDRVIARMKEYMTIINELSLLTGSTLQHPEHHQWIIDEWDSNRENLSFAAYLFPDFYPRLKSLFYKQRMERIFSMKKKP